MLMSAEDANRGDDFEAAGIILRVIQPSELAGQVFGT